MSRDTLIAYGIWIGFFFFATLILLNGFLLHHSLKVIVNVPKHSCVRVITENYKGHILKNKLLCGK